MSVTGASKGANFQKIISISGSSDQILAGGTGTNFTVDLGSNLQLVRAVSFNTVTFPNTVYNIYNDNRGQNNTYNYNFNATTYTFTAAPGFYNLGSLLSLMNADLTTHTGGYAQWSYNVITNTVSITATDDGIHNGIVLNYTLVPPLGLMNLLGGGPLAAVPASLIPGLSSGLSTTLTGDNFPNLMGLDHAYLISEAVGPSNMIEAKGRFSNGALCIPITAAFGSMNMMECKVDDLCEITYGRPRDFSRIDFRLTDKSGNTLDLHGGHVHIVMKVWFNVF